MTRSNRSDSLLLSCSAAVRLLHISALAFAILGAVACIRSPGSVDGDGLPANADGVSAGTTAGVSATHVSPDEATRLAAMEQAAKESLDMIQIERDPDRRLVMIESFLKTWPDSRHAAACIGAELSTLIEIKGGEAASAQAAVRESENPADPRILRMVAECLLDTNLQPDHALELARKALAMELAGEAPFRDAGEPDRVLRERETRYRLTLVRALAANLAWSDALIDCDEALQQAPDNDAGLVCAIHRYRGDAFAGAGKPAEAEMAYLQSIVLGDPRNRQTRASLDALTALTGAETPEAVMDRFRELEDYTGPVFDDVTVKTGLSGLAFGRVAWGDADGDHWPDILLDGSVLLRNEAGASFRDVTAEAGLIPGGSGGLFADLDNDGDLDIFVLSHDKEPVQHETDSENPGTDPGGSGDRLYLNDGCGHFTVVPDYPVADRFPSEGAAWCDLDGDGLADLYVANYEQDVADTGGERGVGSPDRVYRNLGDGHFEDFSGAFVPPEGTPMCGRGVSCADFNNDGHQAVFVSNYRLQRNFLWVNQNHDIESSDCLGCQAKISE